MTLRTESLAAKVVRWQESDGRHHLPWQQTRDPYRVWLSEVMLQQTQVVTVLGYFDRFTQRFPTVLDLANASFDDVLALWSGLGYYSRARNLHACAKRIVSDFGGTFPHDAESLQTLPGIGRSTAGAIASLCFGERVAILDGNVKRVLTRVLGFEDDLSIARHEKQLWEKATEVLPQDGLMQSMQRYTQGMMDLGATVCLSKKPLCLVCPVQPQCVATAQGQPEKYPVRTRTLKRSSQSIWLLWARRKDGAVWLSKRPTPGVWAGLYCLPLMDSEDALQAALPPKLQFHVKALPMVLHVLTHKDLYLHPRVVDFSASASVDDLGQWFLPAQWRAAGLPAPIRKLLEQAHAE